MKKLWTVALFAVMMMLMPVVAMAEGELPVDPFTWQQLATIAGATAATLLIVQLLKLPIDKVWKIPTRIVVYVIALIIMIVAQAFTGGLNWSNAGLAVINAVIVALSAMGAYEMTFRHVDEKRTEKVTEPEEQEEAKED